MVICIIGPCWQPAGASVFSSVSLWSLTPSPSAIRWKSSGPPGSGPQSLWATLHSLSHLEGLLRSASPLFNFCVPLKDTQETSICSPVPIWNYRELGATPIGPLCLETVHSSFSSVAALLGFCFSDFISAVKAHILLLSDPQPLRSFLHLPYSRVWSGLGEHLRDPPVSHTFTRLFLLFLPVLGIIVGKMAPPLSSILLYLLLWYKLYA